MKGGPNAHTISTSLDCSLKCSVCSPTANEAAWGLTRWWLSDQVGRRITLQYVGQICLTSERRSCLLLATPLTPAKASGRSMRDVSQRNLSNVSRIQTKERPTCGHFDRRQTGSTCRWWHLRYVASVLEMTMFCYVTSLSLHSDTSWSLSAFSHALLVLFNCTSKKPEVKLEQPTNESVRMEGWKERWKKQRMWGSQSIPSKFLGHWLTFALNSILPASWNHLLEGSKSTNNAW